MRLIWQHIGDKFRNKLGLARLLGKTGARSFDFSVPSATTVGDKVYIGLCVVG